MIHTDGKYLLKCKDGKFVKVRRSSDALHLHAVDLQGEEGTAAPVVYIAWRDNTKMAFCFSHGSSHYLLKVEGENLNLENVPRCPDRQQFRDHHWFEKVDLKTGEHYGLQVQHAGKPTLYLSTLPKPYRFILSKDKDKCVGVRDIKK